MSPTGKIPNIEGDSGVPRAVVSPSERLSRGERELHPVQDFGGVPMERREEVPQ
jgi:hypothetical protein